MKRIANLTATDLELAPVWRYDGESDEVANLRATGLTELTETMDEVFLARTQFVVASGEQFLGFCSPTDDSGLDYLQPVIVTERGPVFFWFEQPPTHEFLRSQAARLGVPPDSVFPVQFRCTVPVSGKFVTGTITLADVTGAA